ncbi:TonB-dependent receptor, partial [Shinella sp. DD12]|uniref:TonB-dependent receptor domain-containing protein n=1 Tax=Shinella sp. DD12 TaxID=1410620 RepID=UPI00055FE1A3
NRDVLPPVRGRQYELGAKYLVNRRLLLTASLFDIRESNVAVYDTMVDGEALYRSADVRHRGLELEATGQITDRWQLKGGLALLDPKVTNDPEHPVNNGETRPWLPRTTASLYTSYDFVGSITLGGGMRYVGSVKTYDRSSSPTPAIAAYTLFDASIGYTHDRWRLQLNL